MNPPQIPLIEINSNVKLEKDCVKNKLYSDATSEKTDLYEFKMALFYNSESKESFLLVRHFQMNL